MTDEAMFVRPHPGRVRVPRNWTGSLTRWRASAPSKLPGEFHLVLVDDAHEPRDLQVAADEWASCDVIRTALWGGDVGARSLQRHGGRHHRRYAHSGGLGGPRSC